MRRFSSTLAALPLATILCAPAAFADSEMEAAMEQFVVAFNGQDAAGVANQFHVDGKLLPAGEPLIEGRAKIQSYWQGAFDAGVSHIDKTPIEIVVSGDLAVETSSYVVTINDMDVMGKDTLVWRKGSDDGWKISTDIWARDQ